MEVSSSSERDSILAIGTRSAALAIVARRVGAEAQNELARPARPQVEARRVGRGRAGVLHHQVDDQIRLANNNHINGLSSQILVRVLRLEREMGPLASMSLMRNTRARRAEFVRLLALARNSMREIENIYAVLRQVIRITSHRRQRVPINDH